MPGSRSAWTLAIVSIALFMVTLDNLVVTTALPSIRADLGASIEALEWTVNGYTLAFAVLLLTGAAMGDRFGRRRMFLIGLGVFTAASAAAALAPDTGSLIAARAVQGAGAAIIAPLRLTLLTEAFPGERRGMALGVWSGVSGLGVALGPLVGGAVIEGLSWQWIFWLNVPIGDRPAAARGARAAGELRRRPAGSTSPGSRSARPACSASSTGSCAATRRAGAAPRSSATLIAGVALLAAFVAWERRATEPMLPLRFFRSRGFAATNGVVADDVLRHLRRDLPARAVLPDGAGLLAARGRAADAAVDRDADDGRADRGLLSDRIGSRPLMAAGLALQAVAIVWLAQVTSPTVPYAELVPAFVLGGTGMALVFAPAANAVLSAVRPAEAGQASGANNAIRELGGVLGVAVLASVFSGAGGLHVAPGVRRRADPRAVGRGGRAGGRSADRPARPRPPAPRGVGGRRRAGRGLTRPTAS